VCSQHTSASECASRTSIGPMSVGSTVLSMDVFGIRSFGVFGVAACVTLSVRGSEKVRVDLNGSKAMSLRHLKSGSTRGYQAGVSFTMCQRRGPKPAGLESVRHLDDLYYVDCTDLVRH